MLRFLRDNWLASTGFALLAALLCIGIAQFRWITRASEADRTKRQEELQATLIRINDEIELSLREPLRIMRENPRLRPGTEIENFPEQQLSKWKKLSTRPGLVRAVSVGGGDGFFRSCREGACSLTSWPQDLAVYREMLEREMTAPDGDPPLFPRDYAEDFLHGSPILVFPLVEDPILETDAGRSTLPPTRQPRQESPRTISELFAAMRARPLEKPPRKPELTGWCFIELDPDYLEKQLLPEVIAKQDGASRYQWRLSAGSDASTGDGFLQVFGQRVMSPQWNLPNQRLEIVDPKSQLITFKLREGSIAEAVARSKGWSLFFSTAGILILGGAIFLILSTAHRARRLARQQMEFVASISHELRTPLAVIKSTSFNLASGRVDDLKRVQQYGGVIQNEVQRLSEQVDQVMAFAGIETSGFRFQSVQVATVIESVLADFEPQLAGWTVSIEIADPLPTVSGDTRSLESVFRNIIQNAIKYGAAGKWLGVRADATSGKLEIEFSDHGTGIDRGDLKYLFDPFFRSGKVLGSAIPGTGLGLSIAKKIIDAHGGTITVSNLPAAGASFKISLPLESA